MINTIIKTLSTNVNAIFGARNVANGDTCLLPTISKTAHQILACTHQPNEREFERLMYLRILTALVSTSLSSWFGMRPGQVGSMQCGSTAYCYVQHPAIGQRAG